VPDRVASASRRAAAASYTKRRIVRMWSGGDEKRLYILGFGSGSFVQLANVGRGVEEDREPSYPCTTRRSASVQRWQCAVTHKNWI
jgi:hypothetical protein